MHSFQAQVELSPLDEERFGIRSARANHVTAETFPSIMQFCLANDVVFLIARCAVSEIRAAQLMEKYGFGLMDTLVFYVRNLVDESIPEDKGRATVRPIRDGEAQSVKLVAESSFRGYSGHYHADARLDPVACDEAYASWAHRSCNSRDVADEVLVAEQAGEIVGFGTLRLNDRKEGEGVLFGVAPEAQRQGILRSLLVSSMQWFLSREMTCMVYSTQITNTAVQKVLTRLGFETREAYYTFHKWFDELPRSTGFEIAGKNTEAGCGE